MKRLRELSLPIAALLAAGGCGGSSGPAAVVVQAIQGKGPSRCDLYTNDFFAREGGAGAAAGRSYCRQIAATLPTASAKIGRVSSHDNTAFVTAAAAGRTVVYRLVRRGGRWLIDQVGG